MKNLNWTLLSVVLISFVAVRCQSSEAPILDIDDLSAGYVGKISEHSVLVDLMPHLQIKNIEKINGICSYHIFKPNNEEFPFTVEIKDKQTGEAIIELLRKGLTPSHDESIKSARPSAQSVLLDCNSRRSFDFLIQAHDCSQPSLASRKVPVRIDIVDQDDYLLSFDKSLYTATLVQAENHIYEDFLTVRATDHDCSNQGLACAYSLHHELYLDDEFPFIVNNEGHLSTKGQLNAAPRSYQFKVRAYDCVSTGTFVEADVTVEVHEPCVPEWTDYPHEIVPHSKSTPIFDQLSSVKCPQATSASSDPTCRPDSVTAHISLILSDTETCPKTADCSIKQQTISETKTTIFSASTTNSADDDIEESYYVDSNSIESSDQPLSYRSFSKQFENALKISFDGKFGSSFSLQARLRRPATADPKVKEQVFCGSDSLAMNRHHYGLYFYRGSIKFLMRKEASKDHPANSDFYPSLWEWSLPIPDGKWHLYEVRLNYPKAELFVDGQNFIENKTNSDIVDANQLTESVKDAALSSYVGACYHARTNTLVDHFEGEIASIVLTKNNNMDTNQATNKCNIECRERVEVNMIGNERLVGILKTSGANVSFHAKNLEDMVQLLSKVDYVNDLDTIEKEKGGTRLIKLTTSMHCENNGKQISLADVTVNIAIAEKKQFNVHLEGDSDQEINKNELENGVEPFRQVSIIVDEVNRVDAGVTNEEVILSECRVQITPERNLMAPMQNYEKIMFLQNLLDEYKLEFKETLDSVLVRGLTTASNYEAFIRRLTYVVTNAGQIPKDKMFKQKQFLVSCVRSEPVIQTNGVLVELNVVSSQEKNEANKQLPQDRFEFVAHKQAQKLVVGDDSDINLDTINLPHVYNMKASNASPLVVFLVALSIFGTGFFVVLGAIRLSSFMNGKRSAPGEDSPNMDEMMWDDSGLNITENPLDKFESGLVESGRRFDSDEEYTSGGEEEEEDEELEGGEYGSQRFHQELYCPSEEEEQSRSRALEWDDTSVAVGSSGPNKFV